MPIRWRLTLLNAVMIGVILLTLAGSFAWLWYRQSVRQVEEITKTQANEAARALEGVPCRRSPCKGEDLLGQDDDELKQATAGGDVVIVIRNAQGKVLGQMPDKPDFSTGEIHDPVWKEVFKEDQPEHGKVESSSEGADYDVYAIRVKPPDNLAATPTSSARVVEAARPLPLRRAHPEGLGPCSGHRGSPGFRVVGGRGVPPDPSRSLPRGGGRKSRRRDVGRGSLAAPARR